MSKLVLSFCSGLFITICFSLGPFCGLTIIILVCPAGFGSGPGLWRFSTPSYRCSLLYLIQVPALLGPITSFFTQSSPLYIDINWFSTLKPLQVTISPLSSEPIQTDKKLSYLKGLDYQISAFRVQIKAFF